MVLRQRIVRIMRKSVASSICCLLAGSALLCVAPASARAGDGRFAAWMSQTSDLIAGSYASVLESPFYTNYVEYRLEIGTRMEYFTLLEDKRGEPYHGSFVGSITMLKEDQKYSPTRFYAQYRITPFFGAGVSYDRIGAEAWDSGGTDGTAVLSGPLFYVRGCYSNSTMYTPFCELGTAFYSAKFCNSSDWGQAGNKRFDLDLENSLGYYGAIGCDIQVQDQLAIDLYGRYMHVNVDGVYYLNGHKRDDIIFTMSHLALGLGVKFSF